MEDIAPTLGALELDEALIASAFMLIAEQGWSALSIAEAARRAGLDLAATRRRFPCKLTMLMRFDTMADTAALGGALTDGPVRDRIFDIVMRRIDTLQAHRPGVLALLRDLPRDPLTVLALGPASLRSMAWMLEGVGLSAQGLRGKLRTQGMLPRRRPRWLKCWAAARRHPRWTRCMTIRTRKHHRPPTSIKLPTGRDSA
jgi:ubiquinone biosynthesis protein COQ9